MKLKSWDFLIKDKIDLAIHGEGDPPKNDPNKENKKDEGNKEPFAVFPDEQSFMARVNREGKKIMDNLLKNLNVENEEDLKKIVDEQKANADKNKTALEKLQEEVALYKKQNDEYKIKDKQNQYKAECGSIAKEVGINSDKIDYALRLADYSNIPLLNEKADKEVVKAKLVKVLEDFPMLKDENTQNNNSKLPNKGTPTFTPNSGKGLSMDIIKSMSQEEIAERLDEVNAFITDYYKKK